MNTQKEDKYATFTPLDAIKRWSGDGLAPNGTVILKQLKREGRIAIYERTRERDGKLEGYEVIRIRVKVGGSFSNDKTPYEGYPSANEFGSNGKFVTTLDRAEEVFLAWCETEKAA